MSQIEKLAEELKIKNIRSLSRAISIVENRADGYWELMDLVYRNVPLAPIIGITGAPGAGKSTFINRLIDQFVDRGKSVAVLAIDPSSQATGGAFLGDRIRMRDHWSAQQVFIRSLASRGDLGGLCHSAYDIAILFRAAGYDYVLVESVGVGQNEIDLKDFADIVALILVEGMGDEIQFLKAGIMEIPDLFIFNKVDVAPPMRSVQFLRSVSFKGEVLIHEVDSISGKNFDSVHKEILQLSQKKKISQSDFEQKMLKRVFESQMRELFDNVKAYRCVEKMFQEENSPYKAVKKFEKKVQKFLEATC